MVKSLNHAAKLIWDHIAANKEKYRVKVQHYSEGGNLIDCGVEVAGGFMLGRLIALASVGTLAQITFTPSSLAQGDLNSISIRTDHPTRATLACQMGWFPDFPSNYQAVVSGPGRLLAQEPSEFFDGINLTDQSDLAVLLLQSRTPPSDDDVAALAHKCGVKPRHLYLLLAPMTCLAGSTQISSRTIEAVMLKLWKHQDFDPQLVHFAFGSAPIAPPVATISEHRTLLPDDMLVYAGLVTMYINNESDADLSLLADQLIPHNCPAYGASFWDLLQGQPENLQTIDKAMFTVGKITLIDLQTGALVTRGSLDPTFAGMI